jgi:hypothetical protein
MNIKENPQRNSDNRWKVWELHLDEVVKETRQDPKVKINLLVEKPKVIGEAREILKAR